jgi:hypothetical protein
MQDIKELTMREYLGENDAKRYLAAIFPPGHRLPLVLLLALLLALLTWRRRPRPLLDLRGAEGVPSSRTRLGPRD